MVKDKNTGEWSKTINVTSRSHKCGRTGDFQTPQSIPFIRHCRECTLHRYYTQTQNETSSTIALLSPRRRQHTTQAISSYQMILQVRQHLDEYFRIKILLEAYVERNVKPKLSITTKYEIETSRPLFPDKFF